MLEFTADGFGETDEIRCCFGAWTGVIKKYSDLLRFTQIYSDLLRYGQMGRELLSHGCQHNGMMSNGVVRG